MKLRITLDQDFKSRYSDSENDDFSAIADLGEGNEVLEAYNIITKLGPDNPRTDQYGLHYPQFEWVTFEFDPRDLMELELATHWAGLIQEHADFGLPPIVNPVGQAYFDRFLDGRSDGDYYDENMGWPTAVLDLLRWLIHEPGAMGYPQPGFTIEFLKENT